MTTAITPNKFAIEIRDKAGNKKYKVDAYATAPQWEWNRFGGCGACSFSLPGDYLGYTLEADDDVRIYLPNADGLTATLWYRGYIEAVNPSLQGSAAGDIKVECMGYFGMMDRILIHDNEDQKIYDSAELSLMVTDIVTNFIAPNSSIVAGTIDASDYTPDELVFKVSVHDALQTIFDLAGSVECGVDANLNFFWRNQVSTLRQIYHVGVDVAKVSEKINHKDIVNKIHFEGGNVSADTSGQDVLKALGYSQMSIDKYGLHETLMQNGSIVSNIVAQRYMSSLLAQKAVPQRQVDVSLRNIATRFEATQPMGTITIYDHDSAQTKTKWGKTASGGDNKIWGKKINGGSNQLWGGTRKTQIERIVYTMSPEDGKVHADLTLGVPVAFSRASAQMKQIETNVATVRQRQI